MKPILFTVGALPLSSFGFFLLLGCLFGVYIIWRIIKIYDLDEEKSLDLVILTILGGLIASRAYFVVFHLDQFNDFIKIILINRYPGLSFWGALFGGFVVLKMLCWRFKLNFWQMADFAIPALFLGISITSIGCLLGSCEYGLASKAPFAITQVGLVDKRFPIQAVEFLLFFLGFAYLWRRALRFHITGSVVAEGLVILGIFKLSLEFFLGSRQWIGFLSFGMIFSVFLIVAAIRIHYLSSKSSPFSDLKSLGNFFISPNKRKEVVSKINKNWYNFNVDLRVTLKRGGKSLLRFFNIRSNPPKFNL